jgi:hypothetical protein
MSRQNRQGAGMIDMGVRKQHRAKGFRLKPQIAVSPDCLVTAALKHSTIEQQPEARHLQHMSAAGDRTSGSVE